MTEPSVHYWLTVGLFAMAAVTLGLLSFVSAPYGRHVRGGWGPMIPRRIAWLVMESPAVFGFACLYSIGSHSGQPVPLLLLTLWQVHYVHRTLVYPFRARSPGSPWPISIVVVAFCFQTFNAYLNARWISHLGAYETSWLVDPRFATGVAIFLGGFLLNVWSDEKLRVLRSPGDSGYRIPRGGAFEFVSCPNYLGEILEWIGWAIATWSLAGAAFAAYTVANLVPRARSHHRWYKEEFEDYPRGRTALVPRLW